MPAWRPVSNALKSPCLKASIGVVLPKPGSTPERNFKKSRFVKKNVLFRPLYTLGMYTGPPMVNPKALLRTFETRSGKKPRALSLSFAKYS